MTKEQLRIGNIISYNRKASAVLEIHEETLYVRNDKNIRVLVNIDQISPIKINEDWLSKFGFKKIEEACGDFSDFTYELEGEEVYFNYSNDWSIAIADSKNTFVNTSNYLTPNIDTVNEVHKFQNFYHSLTGKELTIN